MIKSVSYNSCKHDRIRHSPNGFDIVEECRACFKAWLIQGITGDVTLLPDSYMVRVMRKEFEVIRIKAY